MRLSSRLFTSSTQLRQPNRIPFPFPNLHIGTDICHIPRVQKLITKERATYYESFKKKLFSSQELVHNQARIEGYELAKDTEGLARFFAGRFAIKEAGVKAYPWIKLQLTSISVIRGKNDNLQVTISPGNGAHEVEARGSLSHDGDYATAVVMAVGPDDISVG